MSALVKVDYDSIKEVVDKLKRQQGHQVRKIPVDPKNLSKGYSWPSISMKLIAQKVGVHVKTLYRKCEADIRIERLLRPFMKKTWNASNAKSGDAPKYGTKAWLEKEVGKLKEKIVILEARKIDLKTKNLQINELRRRLEEKAEECDDIKMQAKQSQELQRQVERLLSENSRLRKMRMTGMGK